MNLNDLENKFFGRILNAELDVPVHSTLEYGENTFGIIVVPEISSKGYFTLKYYNAPPYDPETQFDENGIGTKSWSASEIFGTHPSLERAWLRSDLVNLKIHTSQMPLQPQASPQLRARVLHAEDRHRGTLVLYKSQVIVQDSPLKRAELCLVDFPDFITPERQWRSIAGIGTSEREKLQSVASELGGDATVKIRPSPHRIVLDSGDGWNIALTKDKQQTRGLICHTGLVTRSDDSEYPTDALDDVLDGLKYFFAFTSGVYCHPTVVIGYDSRNLPVWGEIGKFEANRHRVVNWFSNDNNVPFGAYLEKLFPRFWDKWKEKRSEVVAAIECYVHSNAMRRAGIPNDAVAKSYAGLEILASLMLEQTIENDSQREIADVLSSKQVPHLRLNQPEAPVMTGLCRGLNVGNHQGPYLLNTVRNYVSHPLGRGTAAEVKARHLSCLDADPMNYVYLHDLSQFYFEYMLLEFCGCSPSDYRLLLETRHRV